jgi:hypothetical protein
MTDEPHADHRRDRRLVRIPGTVANHVEAVRRRLDVDSLTKVVALVSELGLHG